MYFPDQDLENRRGKTGWISLSLDDGSPQVISFNQTKSTPGAIL